MFLRKIWQNTSSNKDPTCDILVSWTICNHQAFLLGLMMGRSQRFIHSCVFRSSSLTEMQKWMEDIKVAIETAKTSNGPSSDLLTSNLTDNSKLLRELKAEYQMCASVCRAVEQKVGKKTEHIQ